MICGFFGVVIGLERAVAIGRWWAYAGPLLAGLGTRRARCTGMHGGDAVADAGRQRGAAGGFAARAVAPARRLHAHHRAGRGLLDRRHRAVGGRLGGARGRRLVDRLPGADDRRRAARAVALHAAVARRQRSCSPPSSRPCWWRCWPWPQAWGPRAVRRWRCWRWRPGCCAATSRAAPCASRASRASSRCACCRAISGSPSAAR